MKCTDAGPPIRGHGNLRQYQPHSFGVNQSRNRGGFTSSERALAPVAPSAAFTSIFSMSSTGAGPRSKNSGYRPHE